MRRAIRVVIGLASATVVAFAFVVWDRLHAGASDAGPPPPAQVRAALGTSVIVGTVWRAGRSVPATIEISLASDTCDDATDADARERQPTVALWRPATVVARTIAGADGRFEARALARGLYMVRASTEDGARGSTLLGIHHDGERVGVDVQVLVASRSVRARIVRSDGTPVRSPVTVAPCASVDASAASPVPNNPFFPDPCAYAAVAESIHLMPDAHGEIDVVGLPSGAAELFVVDGPIRLRHVVAVADASPVIVELPAPLVVARGRRLVAQATGEPLVGVRFTWSLVVDGSSAAIDAVTDAAGRVPAPRLGLGYRVDAPGFAQTRGWVRWGDRGDGRFERGATIRGRVVRATDGGPVEGHVVEAFREDDWHALRPLARTVTDGDGRYVIADLPAGDLGVRVRGPAGIARGMADLDGSSQRRDRPLDYDPLAVDVLPGHDAVLDVVMEPGARVTGRLTDASGAAVVGAVVRASGSPRYALSSSAVEPPFWEVAETVSGPDGRFVLDGLLPRFAYRLKARRGAERVRAETTTAIGGSEARVDLVFPSSVVVDVRVVDDATGVGVAGVPLSASLADEPESVTAESALVWQGRSDEDGSARVGPVNRVALDFRSAGEGLSIENPKWPAPAEGTVPAFVLRVRRGAGRRIDAAGELRSFVEPREAEDADARTLRVHVVGPDGAPVPDAQLRWVQRRVASGTSRVADGVAPVVRRTGSEPTEVFITDARSRGGVPLPFGRAVGGPFAPEDADVQLAMPRERAVAGRVLDANGRGVRGINVRALVPESPNRFFRNVLDPPASRTDAEGGFRIGGVNDEPIELVVIPPAAYAEVTPIAIPVGATSPLEIRLRPAKR